METAASHKTKGPPATAHLALPAGHARERPVGEVRREGDDVLRGRARRDDPLGRVVREVEIRRAREVGDGEEARPIADLAIKGHCEGGWGGAHDGGGGPAACWPHSALVILFSTLYAGQDELVRNVLSRRSSARVRSTFQ